MYTEQCILIQEEQAVLIYNYHPEVNGVVIITVTIAPNLKDQIAFLKLWKHFLAKVVKGREIYCCLFEDMYEDSPFKRELEPFKKINGIDVYKVRNFMLDKTSVYQPILDGSN